MWFVHTLGKRVFIANLCDYARNLNGEDDYMVVDDTSDGLRKALELVGATPKEKLVTVDVMSKLKVFSIRTSNVMCVPTQSSLPGSRIG